MKEGKLSYRLVDDKVDEGMGNSAKIIRVTFVLEKIVTKPWQE